jgi:peptidyl-tRNA hydrolase, PTH1 family
LKLIIGLGNPGRDYESTRHNIGWWLLDRIASEWSFEPWHRDLDAMVTTRRVRGVMVRLMKPLTYMNLSGNALRPYLRRPTFDITKDLLVVVDDVALPMGRIRLRANGSAGGHNGLKSIEQAASSQSYARFRIGIRPEREENVAQLANFVLGPLSKSERVVLEESAPRLIAAVESWIFDGIEQAMNVYNRAPSSPETEPET